MADPDVLALAVREHAIWCDLLCRVHRFAPQGDARLWWSPRRAPDLVPDAVTLVPDVTPLEVLGRIHATPGASVFDSFATLDLVDQGWSARDDATWIARPPGTGADAVVGAGFATVREKLVFAAWSRAAGSPAGALPIGLRRAPGIAVLGRSGPDGFVDGAIVHHTMIGGTSVAGLWNAFGAWADVAAEASHRHPEAWIVGHAFGPGLEVALAGGFHPLGPLRVWHCDGVPAC